jgi:hypothetical protein
VVAISCCLCSRTVHALLRQGEGQEGRKRLGQQPSHVTSVSARYTRAFSTLGNIAQLAGQKRQDGNEDTDSVTLNFFGCDGTNPRTKNTYKHDITNVWDEVIKIANAITEIDLKKDPAAWDCKWFLC